MATMTHPWYVRRGYFFTKKPAPLPKWFNFLHPYDKYIWGAIGLSVFLMSVTLVVILHPLHKNLKVLQDVFFMVFGIMFQEFAVKWNSLCIKYFGRYWALGQGPLLRFVWVMATLFLIQAYQSNLKASLVIKPLEKQISSLQEMVDRDIPIYMPVAMLQLLVATGRDRLSKDIANKVKSEDTILPLTPTLARDIERTVNEQGGAAYLFREVAEYEQGISQRKGETYQVERIDEIFVYSYQVLAFPYGSPMVEFLNPAIRRIFESGCVQKLYNYYGSASSLREEVSRDSNHLEVEHIIVPLSLLPIAFIISTFAFANEKGWTTVNIQRHTLPDY